MRILESGAFDEIRNLALTKQEKTQRSNQTESNNEPEVTLENKRAFELVFNDKEFKIDLHRVEQIKKEIEEGRYEANSVKIAEEIIKSEYRGDSNMGLFNREPE
jgi:anti-sigma28 factor (negative regulator of flagellin synthesis)